MFQLSGFNLPFAMTTAKVSDLTSALIVALTSKAFLFYFVSHAGNGTFAKTTIDINGCKFYVDGVLEINDAGVVMCRAGLVGPADARAKECYFQSQHQFQFIATERMLQTFKDWRDANPETYTILTNEVDAHIKNLIDEKVIQGLNDQPGGLW